MVIVPSEGDRRVAIMCLTLIISKPRLTSQSDMIMSSAGCCVASGISLPSCDFRFWDRTSDRRGYRRRNGIRRIGNPPCLS
jgi:hypothetical protein